MPAFTPGFTKRNKLYSTFIQHNIYDFSFHLRSKLEKEVGGTAREKFVEDEKNDIRNKERKVSDNLEANKAKLAQLNLKVIEILTLIGFEETGNKPAKHGPDKDVQDMIG
jgi:hypothetical protein